MLYACMLGCTSRVSKGLCNKLFWLFGACFCIQYGRQVGIFVGLRGIFPFSSCFSIAELADGNLGGPMSLAVNAEVELSVDMSSKADPLQPALLSDEELVFWVNFLE